jgi:hypothetical protein
LSRQSRVVLILLTLVFTLAIATPVFAWNKGCTPGFWKNHPEAWVGYDPNQTIGSVFSAAPAPFDSMSLIDGLSLQGGPDLAGKTEILLRAAIAGLLNRDYPAPQKFIDRVNAKIMSGDETKIINFATKLDNQNNGDCTAD